MTDLFRDIIPSIMLSKKDVLVDELSVKTYSPFVVNKSLSYHIDCVLYANEMNMNYYNLSNKMQYDYLLSSIRPRKRPFMKWAKKVKQTDVDNIKLYFGYSTRAAIELLESEVLSEGQLKYIRKQTQIED